MEEEFNDKKSRVEKLRASNPDAVNFNNEYELNRDAAKRWMKDNLRGEYVNADTGEKIEVSKVGANKVTSHGERDKAHLMSIVAIPSLIEKSIFIEERPNEKGNDKYDSYRYYVCGVKINGEDYTAKVVIGVKDGSKYYDHLLTQIERGTLIDNLNGIAKSVAENQNADVSVGKDTKWLSILQTNDVQNAEKIKSATGWERGADGKWRYETEDVAREDNTLLGKEKVNLLYPATEEELKRRISQVSTEPNSPLNALSSALGAKVIQDFENPKLSDMKNFKTRFSIKGRNAERQLIINEAKKNGTWMKAPNGNPTFLTERQWVQVRTKALKDLFGDWEKVLRKAKDAVITGSEISEGEITKKEALEYGKTLQGEYTNADTGSKIELQRGRKNGGVNEVLQHNYKDQEHLKSIAAIPQIIEKSIYIGSEANMDKVKNPNVSEFQHYVCGLKLGEVDYTVHSLIAVDVNGGRYYDHNLTQIEKTKLLDLVSQAVMGEDFGTTPDTKSTILSGNKGKRLISILQTNSSKIVDDNGGPMVVCHDTNSRIFINRETGENWDDLDWRARFLYL